jgi:hypothetical protein
MTENRLRRIRVLLCDCLFRLIRRNPENSPSQATEYNRSSTHEPSNFPGPLQPHFIPSSQSGQRDYVHNTDETPSNATTSRTNQPPNKSESSVFGSSANLASLIYDIKEGREREQLLEWLSPGITNRKHHETSALRLPDTGRWFWNEVEKWLDEQYTSVLLCWGMRTYSCFRGLQLTLVYIVESGKTILTYLLW